LFLILWLSHQYPICIHLLPHSYYMPCPSHPRWFDHSNYTWRRVQVMKPFFRNELIFYGKELLAPRSTPKLKYHPLSAFGDFLFNIFSATLRTWRASPPAATWGRPMPWWQGTHLIWGIKIIKQN
jgi:hypothetical protein